MSVNACVSDREGEREREGGGVHSALHPPPQYAGLSSLKRLRASSAAVCRGPVPLSSGFTAGGCRMDTN